MEIMIDPALSENKIEGSLYTRGAHLTTLSEVRRLLYEMQRPGISPSVRVRVRYLSTFLIVFCSLCTLMTGEWLKMTSWRQCVMFTQVRE
jgi:hypothetical protein